MRYRTSSVTRCALRVRKRDTANLGEFDEKRRKKHYTFRRDAFLSDGIPRGVIGAGDQIIDCEQAGLEDYEGNDPAQCSKTHQRKLQQQKRAENVRQHLAATRDAILASG